MPRLLSLPAAAALAASLLLSPLPLRAAGDSDVIGRVGDETMTADDLRAAIQNLDPKTQAAVGADPAALSQVVRVLLAQRLVLKEALANKWDQNPAVTTALARLRENAIEQTYLQSLSKPPDTYPSDNEVQAAYDANKAKLLVPRQYHLSHVFIKNPKGADPADAAKAQVKLDSVRKALAKKGADFAAIARADSDESDTAAKGGDIGWLAESRIQPEIRSQLGTLAKGSISQPVRLDDGWHILKVLEVKEPYNATLAEIRPQLVQQMRAEKARVNSQQYVAKLIQDHPIQINELSLSKVLKPQ